MRYVYGIRDVTKPSALNLSTTSTVSGPHTSISSPLKAGFIEEGKNVEVSEGIDVRDEVIVKHLHPAKIASARTHEEIISVPVWILPGHSFSA
jgi:hypothetical protein